MNNQNNIPNNNNNNQGPPVGGPGGDGWNWVHLAGCLGIGYFLGFIPSYWIRTNAMGNLDKDNEERFNLHNALNIKNSQLTEELKKNQQLQEQNKQLQRKHEQLEEKHKQLQKLEEKKMRMVTTLHQVEDEVQQLEQSAQVLLKVVEPQLVRRQQIMCTRPLTHWQEVGQIQKNLLSMVANNPMEPKLKLKEALDNIFHYENYCVNPADPSDVRNGRMMWLYLKLWKQQITLQKHKKIEEVLKDAIPNDRNYK